MSQTVRLLSKIFPPVRRLAEDHVALHKQSRDELKKLRKSYISLQERCHNLEPWQPERARLEGPAFRADSLSTSHTPGFLQDAGFIAAYQAGVDAIGEDFNWPWRVHIALWVARQALELRGDFVECGAGRGFLSAAVQQYLDWPNTSRTFWMLDTFDGLVESQISREEKAIGRKAGKEGNFYECAEAVRKVFAHRQGVRIVRGMIPDSLTEVTSEEVAFCSIDLNCAAPEIESGDFFWDRLVHGAYVLLDDYSHNGFEPQRVAWDQFAARHSLQILNLPTGQGLWRKP